LPSRETAENIVPLLVDTRGRSCLYMYVSPLVVVLYYIICRSRTGCVTGVGETSLIRACGTTNSSGISCVQETQQMRSTDKRAYQSNQWQTSFSVGRDIPSQWILCMI